ncbi:MAG: glycosyltransferase family 4 protein [Magnetococcus sp. DMHC-6]
MKICHVTSVHPRADSRIFLKYCRSLAQHGFECHLVVVDPFSGMLDGIHVHGLSIPVGGRLQRMTKNCWKVYRKALALDADIYHFHDPELIPYGLLLRLQGYRVIYDAHEDVPADILGKKWIPSGLRSLISFTFKLLENFSARRFSAVVGATPFISERFQKIGCRTINVNNYPLQNELKLSSQHHTENREPVVCYVGMVSELRGIFSMLEAIDQSGVDILLAGPFDHGKLRDQLTQLPGWKRVRELGQISREAVANVMHRSIAGLVLYLPDPNHNNAQPHKLFEYMSSELPVIASDFPLWKRIIEENRCGICVNPEDPKQIAEAILRLKDNPDLVKEMGINGRRAILEKFNWEWEFQKITALYKELV